MFLGVQRAFAKEKKTTEKQVMKQQFTIPHRKPQLQDRLEKGQKWGRNQNDINGDEGRSHGQHTKEEIKYLT